MSLKIRWQSEEDGGAFSLRTHPLHLLCSDGMFDMVALPPHEQDGISLAPPDSEGRIQLEAFGELTFIAKGKRFQKVRLPIGGRVAFQSGSFQGHLHADGKAPVNDPLVGTTLNGHELLGRLGAGAVGVVYRAKQLNLDREVALKLLNEEAAQKPLAVASFRREAQAAGRLSHPNLVQVYDVGQEGKLFYYTMELVPGGNFEERLDEIGVLPWREAVSAIRDCCKALAYAQEHDLVHRDVKPENLMIGAGGVVKLADLGLAATRGMLADEAAGGTPHFMAPEAIDKGKTEHRSDLYSVGCTLYRLLTGHTVFEGASVKDILLAHRDQDPPTLRDAGVDAPRGLDDLLAELLAKSPEDRPEHASDVAEYLEHLLLARSSKRMVLLAVPLLAIGAWGLYQAFKPPPEPVEPERVIEYVPNAQNAAAEAELARQKVRLAYLEAKGAGEGLAGVTALEGFLEAYPDSQFQEDAAGELQRLQALIAAAASASAETPEQTARREAIEQATAKIRQQLKEQNFAVARSLARQGVLATEEAMLNLATLVDDIADTQFLEWEVQHQEHLDQQDWAAALTLRADFAQSLDDVAPAPWQARLYELQSKASEMQTAAKDAAFLQARLDFLTAASQPVRDAIRTMDFELAGQRWAAAANSCSHGNLAQLASQQQGLFEQAAKAVALMKSNLAQQELDLIEPIEQRKVQVLKWTADGLLLRVQVDGERVERTDAWQLYQEPQGLHSLLAALAPVGADQKSINALYMLIAYDQLADILNQLAAQPDAAQAAITVSAIRRWRDALPFSDLITEQVEFGLQAAEDLCKALLKEDDYLALARLEEFHASFSVLGAWTSQGLSLWGLEAE